MENNSDVVFCTNCGKENNIQCKFCSVCGTQLNTNEETFNQSNIKEKTHMDDINAYVSKNVQYYQNKFDIIEKTGNKNSWNWAAFFLTVYWMLYRKMYVPGVLYLLGTTAIAQIPYMGPFISLGITICTGMYANAFYLDYIKKQLNTASILGEEAKQYTISKKGGVNIIAPIILLIASIIIGLLLLFLFFGVLGFFMYGY